MKANTTNPRLANRATNWETTSSPAIATADATTAYVAAFAAAEERVVYVWDSSQSLATTASVGLLNSARISHVIFAHMCCRRIRHSVRLNKHQVVVVPFTFLASGRVRMFFLTQLVHLLAQFFVHPILS